MRIPGLLGNQMIGALVNGKEALWGMSLPHSTGGFRTGRRLLGMRRQARPAR